MPGQLRNEIGKRGITSSSDAAADEELVAAAKNGDELGFESLAKRYQRRIFALAFRYTRVREDAEDIVQETFRKAFVHLQKFEGKSSFSTWSTRVAINEALSRCAGDAHCTRCRPMIRVATTEPRLAST